MYRPLPDDEDDDLHDPERLGRMLDLAPTPFDRGIALQVLYEEPSLIGAIEAAIERSREFFPEATIHLEASRYEEGDPLLTVRIEARQPFEEFWQNFETYSSWLARVDIYNGTLLDVFPVHAGVEAVP